jgi:predicted nucleic acid-binding protein
MLRVVLDTNVLVSAIISDGKPRELCRKGISKEFCMVTSDSILKELAIVLHRPKFKRTYLTSKKRKSAFDHPLRTPIHIENHQLASRKLQNQNPTTSNINNSAFS